MGKTPSRRPARAPAPGQAEGLRQPSLAALARGPLGVIIAICAVCEVGLGVAVRSPVLRPGTATFLVIAMALLAFVLLVGFLYAWLFAPPGRLFAPGDFDDQSMWERTVRPLPQDAVASTPIRLDDPASPPVRPEAHGAAAFIATEAGELQRGSPTTTGVSELTSFIAESAGWDYLLVDVGNGGRWLLSRLFGFVMLYDRQHGLPCIVFVRGANGNRRLLGIIETGKLCGQLARLYPWFNDALAQSLLELNVPVFGSTPLGQWVAGNVFDSFIQRLQDAGPHDGDPDWNQLRPDKWEHTRWLHEGMLRNELQPALVDELQSRLPAFPADEINQMMMLRIIGLESRFVALVDSVGTFIRLYDRRRLFATYQKRIAQSELMEAV
jgi:hypothetical protein